MDNDQWNINKNKKEGEAFADSRITVTTSRYSLRAYFSKTDNLALRLKLGTLYFVAFSSNVSQLMRFIAVCLNENTIIDNATKLPR